MRTSGQLDSPLIQKGNEELAKEVLEELLLQGITTFCLCPSARNAPFVYPLIHCSQAQVYYWPEERSAAFFALGRIKATSAPVAVVTTSGTAVAELLPAAMEAYYTGLPLVLLTADRPRRFRGTGAPQSAEQVGLFSCYVHEMLDLAGGEACDLCDWKRQGPLHLNVCFEEPLENECKTIRLDPDIKFRIWDESHQEAEPDERYFSFLQHVRYPFVILGAISSFQREAAVRYLLHLNAPLYAEAISGLREEPRLEHLQIRHVEHIWRDSTQHDYPIDGILRLGGIPTARLWRDVEDRRDELLVCSVSELPFSGLSSAEVIHTPLYSFFSWAHKIESPFQSSSYQKWKKRDQDAYRELLALFQEEPLAEPSLVHTLSTRIPFGSKVYLGNSMPIREWDLAATNQSRGFELGCNRGVNGIDGQMATFLGFSSSDQANWSILGDLTILYDLVAPWVTSQIQNMAIHVVVINNGGAGIFARMFSHPAFQNRHSLTFEPFAEFWRWEYQKWESIPTSLSSDPGGHLIELIPDPQSTFRFFQRLKEIS